MRVRIRAARIGATACSVPIVGVLSAVPACIAVAAVSGGILRRNESLSKRLESVLCIGASLNWICTITVLETVSAIQLALLVEWKEELHVDPRK
jgi:hypothetical protein